MIKIPEKYLPYLANILGFSYRKLAKPASTLTRKVFEFKQIKEVLGVIVLTLVLLTGLLPSLFISTQTFFLGNSLPVPNQTVTFKTEGSLQSPVSFFHLTKQYGFFHPGLDFATDAGTAVLPILPGKVEKVARLRFGYGNHILINHGSGLKSLYGHLAKINVKEGDLVEKSTVIGLIGSTGWSTGPHLHLEISDNGQKINPRALFEEYFGYKLASRGKIN